MPLKTIDATSQVTTFFYKDNVYFSAIVLKPLAT